MTKDEALDIIVQNYKNNTEQNKIKSDYCQKVNWDCEACPFGPWNTCEDLISKSLIERLLKNEEHQKAETNLEHYFKNANVAIGKGFLNILFGDEVNEAFGNSKATYNLREWLLSPYEEPKYKLSKFEYDLFNSCYDKTYGIKESWILKHMHDKGYFKGIPTDVPIRNILDNCEVIES